PCAVDNQTFLAILNRLDGFKRRAFVRGVQIREKEGDGFVSAGELRDVSTRLGD
ncbi:hypothetical protein M407DRAFT_59638, partial [Tulasnella calospora MUT 4182]